MISSNLLDEPGYVNYIHQGVLGATDIPAFPCPFPQAARWDGKGSTDDATSFACR